MSKYTEALNEIIKYQYPMQGIDRWRNAMLTCKEALEIADRLEYAYHSKDCKYCKIEDWDGDNYRVCKRDQHIRSGSWFCADGRVNE